MTSWVSIIDANVLVDGRPVGRASAFRAPKLRPRIGHQSLLGSAFSVEIRDGFEKLEAELNWSQLFPAFYGASAGILPVGIEVVGRSVEGLPARCLMTAYFSETTGERSRLAVHRSELYVDTERVHLYDVLGNTFVENGVSIAG